MAKNTKFKWDIKKIVLAILLVAVIIGVATGKISLANLLGLDTGTPAATESGAVSSEASSLPATQASTGEVVTLVPGPTVTPTKETTTAAAKTTAAPETTKAAEKTTEDSKYVEYKFRNKDRLDEHYVKHGEEMGFPNAAAYQKAASDIINAAGQPGVLSKYKSDGSRDQCYYVEATKEFVVLSNDGYIRTYYICSGIKYYNRQ